jgi:hypothetical protein
MKAESRPEAYLGLARQWCKRFLCLPLVLLFLNGCHRDAAVDAGDSDANGYLCRRCGLKFYTDRKLFAEHCPKCQSTDVPSVIGFVCARDNHTTLTTAGQKSAVCELCQSRVTAIRLPREADLRNWGAVKAKPAEVLGNNP